MRRDEREIDSILANYLIVYEVKSDERVFSGKFRTERKKVEMMKIVMQPSHSHSNA